MTTERSSPNDSESREGALAGEVPVVEGRIIKADKLLVTGAIGYLSFERHREWIAYEETRDESRFFSGRFTDGITTRELLAETCRSGEISSQEMELLIGKMGLHGLLHRQVRTLSTGEIRMVLIDWIGQQPATQLLYVTYHPAEVLSCITHAMRFEKIEGNRFRVIQAPVGEYKMAGELSGNISDGNGHRG